MTAIPAHGTWQRYNTTYAHRCRCAECRAAWAAHSLALWEIRAAGGLTPDDPRHGTSNGYGNWGCRCHPCTDANTTAMRNYRQGRPR